MGILYIVATPIGNLEDITIRVMKTLQEVDVIACEDTRRTGLLISNLQTRFPTIFTRNDHPQLLSYYEENELQRIPEIMSVLQNGMRVALVSDAGTPAISDPGFKLIREAQQAGIEIVSLPGPSSVIAALTSSGLPTDKFLFLGYPPRKPGNRQKVFASTQKSVEHVRATIIFFEGPHRLEKTLTDLMHVFGDIEIVVAKELTKIHEKIRKDKISWFMDQYKKYPPKGEFVILFHAAHDEE
jgi:16S rRNA (cytidine1402-2'-O)-methyltransferase